MSQINLQKLTKKNQEFVHIATQQFIKDGKTDAESRLFLRKSFLKFLKSKPKVRLLVPSMVHRLIGLTALAKKSNTRKNIQRKTTIQN